MKTKLATSAVLSLIFTIAPFFLFNFEVQLNEEVDSIVQQQINKEYEEVSGSWYDELYSNDKNQDDGLGNELYYYKAN